MKVSARRHSEGRRSRTGNSLDVYGTVVGAGKPLPADQLQPMLIAVLQAGSRQRRSS